MTNADLILHPIRIRLMVELYGREMTSRELAEQLPDIPQATLYRHIKKLVEGGVYTIVSEEMVNGAMERTFAVAQGAGRISPEEMGRIGQEAHIQYFTIFATALIDSFTRYMQQTDPSQVVEDGLSYNEAVIYLSDEERTHFQDTVTQLIESVLANRPDPSRKRYRLASVVIPD